MRGELKVTLWGRGKVISVDQGPNIFTKVGIDALARLVIGHPAPPPSNYYVDRMQFGTGQVEATEDDIILQVPITPVKTISTITHSSAPGEYWVKFEAFLMEDEANGFPVGEAGLLTVGGVLAARRVFSQVSKTSDYVIQFEWIINT